MAERTVRPPAGVATGTPERVAPSRADPLVSRLAGPVGGAWGRHAVTGRQRFWTPVRVLLALLVLTLAGGWLAKAPCQTHRWAIHPPVASPGSGQPTEVRGKEDIWLCYSDVVSLYQAEGLDRGAVPYRDHGVEYPVLTGFFMYGAREAAAGYDAVARGASGVLPRWPAVQSYFEVTAVLLAICALVTLWCCARLAGRRIWDIAMVALAPLLVVHAFTNWDLFAVALASAAMLGWARGRPVLAGVLIGLGTAAKLYPVLLLAPLLVLCLRAGRLREFGRTATGAALAWVAVNLPVALLWGRNWAVFFTSNTARGADHDTLWEAGQYLSGARIPTGTLDALTLLLVAAVFAGVAMLALRAERRPRLPQLAFLLVAGFLLTNKVWSPQYSLWLLPLAVLARPSWRVFLGWQAAEVLLWLPREYWLLQGTLARAGLTPAEAGVHTVGQGWFVATVLLRDVVVIVYAALIVRDILRPGHDVVRRDGVDDPAGGVLHGAPDRWLLAGVSPRRWRLRAVRHGQPAAVTAARSRSMSPR